MLTRLVVFTGERPGTVVVSGEGFATKPTLEEAHEQVSDTSISDDVDERAR